MKTVSLLVILCSIAAAQTTFTNQSGGCTTNVSCTLSLSGGAGNISFSAVVGPSCILGQSCAFGNGTAGSFFAYRLADGSSASVDDFAGQMTSTGAGSCGPGCSAFYYTLTGTFSGQDSQGRSVSGSTLQDIVIDHTHGSSATDTAGATTLTVSAALADLAPVLSLSAASSLPAVTAGQSAAVTIAVTGQALTAPISLTCLGLPAGATCSFNPPSLTIGATPVSSVLSISTTAASTARRKLGNAVLFSLLPGFGLILLPRWRRRLAALIAVSLILLALGGCSGSVGTASNSSRLSSFTPAGSYQIAVIGTSASVQGSATVSLIVN